MPRRAFHSDCTAESSQKAALGRALVAFGDLPTAKATNWAFKAHWLMADVQPAAMTKRQWQDPATVAHRTRPGETVRDDWACSPFFSSQERHPLRVSCSIRQDSECIGKRGSWWGSSSWHVASQPLPRTHTTRDLCLTVSNITMARPPGPCKGLGRQLDTQASLCQLMLSGAATPYPVPVAAFPCLRRLHRVMFARQISYQPSYGHGCRHLRHLPTWHFNNGRQALHTLVRTASLFTLRFRYQTRSFSRAPACCAPGGVCWVNRSPLVQVCSCLILSPCSAPGTFANTTGSAYCHICPPGKISAAGASSCTDCNAGYYNGKAGGTVCQKCPAGTLNTQHIFAQLCFFRSP